MISYVGRDQILLLWIDIVKSSLNFCIFTYLYYYTLSVFYKWYIFLTWPYFIKLYTFYFCHVMVLTLTILIFLSLLWYSCLHPFFFYYNTSFTYYQFLTRNNNSLLHFHLILSCISTSFQKSDLIYKSNVPTFYKFVYIFLLSISYVDIIMNKKYTSMTSLIC